MPVDGLAGGEAARSVALLAAASLKPRNQGGLRIERYPIRGFTCRGLIEARWSTLVNPLSWAGSVALLAAASLKRVVAPAETAAGKAIRGFTCRGLIEAIMQLTDQHNIYSDPWLYLPRPH